MTLGLGHLLGQTDSPHMFPPPPAPVSSGFTKLIRQSASYAPGERGFVNASPSFSRSPGQDRWINDFGDSETAVPAEKPPHQIAAGDLGILRQTLMSNHLKLQEEIGAGGFATIFKAWHVGYTQFFAVKVMENEHAHCYASEIANLRPLLHPNIIKLYNVFHDTTFNYVVMEYCPSGTLKDMVGKSGVLNYPTFYSIARQLLGALAHCHAMGIAHSDIKPANVFFDEHMRPKLADFGLSHRILAPHVGGSVPYMAPEVVNKLPDFDPVKADIWSLGMTFYFCAVGILPWRGMNARQIADDIRRETFSVPDEVDERMTAVISPMIKRDPERRAPIETVLQILAEHPPSPEENVDSIVGEMPMRDNNGGSRKSPARWIDMRLKVGTRRTVGPLATTPVPTWSESLFS
jgi:serine/threonine protein kinase